MELKYTNVGAHREETKDHGGAGSCLMETKNESHGQKGEVK